MGWSEEAMASELKFMNKTLKSIDESLKIIAGRKSATEDNGAITGESNLPKGYPANNH